MTFAYIKFHPRYHGTAREKHAKELAAGCSKCRPCSCTQQAFAAIEEPLCAGPSLALRGIPHVFRTMSCQYLSAPIFSVPGRAKIFRAKIFHAGPCHRSAGPRIRAVPRRPCARKILAVDNPFAFGKMLCEQRWKRKKQYTTVTTQNIPKCIFKAICN